MATRSSWETCSREGMDGLPLHHSPAHFASSFLRFLFAAYAGRLIILSAFDLLHDAVAFAFLLKSAQGLFNGFVFSDFNNRQWNTVLSIVSLAANLIFCPLKRGSANARR